MAPTNPVDPVGFAVPIRLSLLSAILKTRFIIAGLKCTALPDDIPNLKTNTTLPVYHGTNVKVECEVGYSQSGSSVITCIQDKDWKFAGDSPHCALGGLATLQVLSP